jgi:isoleucyl-tRNA synthetase
MDYSKTVNLLQTAFPMKADLPTREPERLKLWNESRLYQKIQDKNRDKPVFLLHDGPPYANGDIHMGHALNKVLKDFVVKYKTLAGFRSPYKPGWDCHGLPIEHQLFKQLGKNKHQVTRPELREKATEYALGWVEKQKEGFKRLGVLGDWDNPYLTLSKDYEASTVQAFYELYDKGFVYRGLKPGYWCVFDETALAEAEVEYAEKKSDSVYVRFKVDQSTLPSPFRERVAEGRERADTQDALTPALSPKGEGVESLYVLIWTTTPWTLPANTGLAFHPGENYVVLKVNNEGYIVAEKLAEKASKLLEKKWNAPVTVSTGAFKGEDVAGLIAENPLHGRESRAVTANYVTMEDGTGIVHIAPGHGVEDFGVGQANKLATLSPVDEAGRFDMNVGRAELVGKHVLKDANQAVMDLLGDNLIAHYSFTHSYPHCWRCKNPSIFRATEQWFLRVDDAFREGLLRQIDQVRWEPSYGVHRIKGMVEVRPDWCLSRQRHWGAPIAVYYCANKTCRAVLWDKELNKKIVDMIRAEGGTAWYSPHPDPLPQGERENACAKCGGTSFEKETDILDVWFDSGISWFAVVEKEFSQPKPQTIMYLEGSDQHRGWFQTSLIPSVALRGKAPYDVVLTHGFVVDGKGHKMSKSLGNVIGPQEIIEKYGADVLRLWVAMSDYREDVRMSQDIVKHVIDMYRRFRNTFRFLLQNTADFKQSEHALEFDRLEEVDRWIVMLFEETKQRVLKAYEAYEFHAVLGELNKFVAGPLSGFYMDAQKDRLYCEAPASPLRRSAQTSLALLLRGLCVLLAPLLSFTSEEAYEEFRKASAPGLPESVFLDALSELKSVSLDAGLLDRWSRVLDIRRLVNDELDKQRKLGVLKSSQEARLQINPVSLSEENQALLSRPFDWPFALQMASIDVIANGGTGIEIQATSFPKCERCWRHRQDVGQNAAHPALCGRCAAVVC